MASNPARAGISVSIESSSSIVNVGDTFTVDILADVTIVGWAWTSRFQADARWCSNGPEGRTPVD